MVNGEVKFRGGGHRPMKDRQCKALTEYQGKVKRLSRT